MSKFSRPLKHKNAYEKRHSLRVSFKGLNCAEDHTWSSIWIPINNISSLHVCLMSVCSSPRAEDGVVLSHDYLACALAAHLCSCWRCRLSRPIQFRVPTGLRQSHGFKIVWRLRHNSQWVVWTLSISYRLLCIAAPYCSGVVTGTLWLNSRA